jgi:hypothetical protein
MISRRILLTSGPPALLAASLGFWLAGAQAPSAGKSSPQLTADRLHGNGWWPTRRDAPRGDYAGAEACAECHQPEFAAQRQTSMAKAASRSVDTGILRSNAKISLETPLFATTITRGKQGSTYTVARGGDGMSGQILWSMGDGTMGTTFIVESGGGLYESQLSYFTAIHALDLTPGHLPAGPRDLQAAFGERQSEATAQQCFACHTTISSSRGQFDPARATPGVTCEACHGPGGRHVAAMRGGHVDEGRAAILNPAQFDPVKLVDYCGACHRTPLDVAAAKDFVPINIRFQPYRLAKSRCWSQPDARLACTACHNPHEQVERDATFYDAKCLACHASKTATGVTEKDAEAAKIAPSNPSEDQAPGKRPACPVGASQCTTCHMPKYNVPSMHGSFTDHDIRIVRPGAPYPI